MTATKRIRRTPADLRAEALAAARKLIVQGGGEALTMRAVADEIGVTYPNLSHHFGSAAGLHAAVAEELVRDLLEGLRAIGADMQRPLENPQRVVDIFFDMFDRDGLGRVVSWLARADDTAGAERVHSQVEEHLARMGELYPNDAATVRGLFPKIALILTLTAYAESSAGGLFGIALGLSEEDRRAAVVEVLTGMKKRIDG